MKNNLQIFAAFLCDNIREDSPGKIKKKKIIKNQKKM